MRRGLSRVDRQCCAVDGPGWVANAVLQVSLAWVGNDGLQTVQRGSTTLRSRWSREGQACCAVYGLGRVANAAPQVSLAIMKACGPRLMKMNEMEDLMGYLKDEVPLMDPEKLQVRLLPAGICPCHRVILTGYLKDEAPTWTTSQASWHMTCSGLVLIRYLKMRSPSWPRRTRPSPASWYMPLP